MALTALPRRRAARFLTGRLPRRLKWQFEGLEHLTARRERAAMAKASVYILGGGGGVGALSLLLPGSPTRNEAAVLAICATALAVAAVCLAFLDRLPLWFLGTTPAVVTALVTCDLVFGGDPDSASPVFYFVVALYAFNFLPFGFAALHMAGVAASEVVVMAATDGVTTPDNALIRLVVLWAAAFAFLHSKRRLKTVVGDLAASRHAIRSSAEETIRRLSLAAEFRDTDTGDHVRRVSEYSALLARELGLDEERCDLIRTASLLHDIGKIGIPDSVLDKTGPLDLEEIRLVREHAVLGHRLLAGSGQPMLDVAATIALTHHERWDGKGYPRGVAGADIPIEGRITAVADVFDSLTSPRAYRPAHTVADAMAIMTRERGGAFDPDVLDAFFRSRDAILTVRSRYADADAPAAAVA